MTAIKFRVIAAFVVVHAGLILGVFALAKSVASNGWDTTAYLNLAAVACLYFGFFLGAFFIAWPLLPWFKRAQKVEHWTQRWVQELPALIDNLPKILLIIQSIRTAWKDSSSPSKSNS